jgi:RNA polymerase sigma-70 factor (ECF subfamily)
LNDNYSDQELLQLLRHDEDMAMTLIFRRHFHNVFNASYRLYPDRMVAEDLTQEVFVELWRRRERLAVNSSLSAYLRRAAVNKTLNHLRETQKIKFVGEDRFPAPESIQESAARSTTEAEELRILIDKAIDSLPERCRIIFVLSRYEDLSHAEIARLLDISAKTVENQVAKALRWLREALGPYLPSLLLLLIAY